jgi:hypothetical protein
MKYLLVSFGISAGLVLNPPVIAQTTYPVANQSATYPLKTQISPTQIAEFEKIFRFGSFNPQQAIALRAKLQPLADANDPVACYWLAQTYDWEEFGVGKDVDRPHALKWYHQAAKLNYQPAAYFLYQTYFYGFMGVKIDYTESIEWLNRSLELSAGEAKAKTLADFARLSEPNVKDTSEVLLKIIPRNRATHLAYLKQAFEIAPRNTSIADYYGGSLYDAKHYAEALMVFKNSGNAYTWRRIGKMYENGEGTTPDPLQALSWYKKMVTEGKEQENDINPISFYGKTEIYRLVCLKKVTPQQAKPIYTDEDYQQLAGRFFDKKCNPSAG